MIQSTTTLDLERISNQKNADNMCHCFWQEKLASDNMLQGRSEDELERCENEV
jgi:hypothetical protein